MSLITPIVHRWIQDGLREPEQFWARAAEQLPWFRPWDSVFEWTFPTFRWFIGAETNLAYNALDRHVAAGRGGAESSRSLQRRPDHHLHAAVS